MMTTRQMVRLAFEPLPGKTTHQVITIMWCRLWLLAVVTLVMGTVMAIIAWL